MTVENILVTLVRDAERLAIIAKGCPFHKHYRGVRPPKVESGWCKCYEIYEARQSLELFDIKTMRIKPEIADIVKGEESDYDNGE